METKVNSNMMLLVLLLIAYVYIANASNVKDIAINKRNLLHIRQSIKECKSTKSGIEYMGTLSESVYGDSCLVWTERDSSDDPVGTTDDEFPDSDIRAAKNYCRNPDNDTKGPWCFTDTVETWAYCDVPYCEHVYIDRRECKKTAAGAEYAGTVSTTQSGSKCLIWAHLKEHIDKKDYFNYQFPENDIKLAKNYCRNPNNDQTGPGVYISMLPFFNPTQHTNILFLMATV